MTYIIGISAYFHDSAAALIHDGEILLAVQEERFTRIKHDQSFPFHSIKFLLNKSKLSLDQIQYVAFYDKPFLKFERLIQTYVTNAPKGFKSFKTSMPLWLKEKLFQKKIIYRELKKISKNFDIKKILFSEHHFSHAASAFFPSIFQKALIFTVDGVGEWATTTVAIGEENNINILKEIHFPHSLGLLYSSFTYYLGFKVNSGEYKVMGLAPYGDPKYKELIYDHLIDVKKDGSFFLNQKYFDYSTGLKMINKKFESIFNQPARIPEKDKIQQFHMDVAASIQSVIEEIINKILYDLKEEYKIENLCMAGGVALNVVANSRILKEKIFKNIWVQPASGDAGGSIGAALAVYYQELKKSRKIKKEDGMKGCLLGPNFSKSDVEKFLKKIGANFHFLDKKSIIEKTAILISTDKVVGWFHGNMEFGPRALGSRSILANPLSENMQSKLNLKIKFRESFRPFAGAILRKDLNDWFEFDMDSPYMLFVSQIKNNIKYNISDKEKKFTGFKKLKIKRSKIPSITHVDNSCRIQTVHKELNPMFYSLIEKFNEITGCPIIINTSFNVRGEPIVLSPQDAFKCFMGTEMDALIMENYVLYKDDQDANLKKDYQKKYELD